MSEKRIRPDISVVLTLALAILAAMPLAAADETGEAAQAAKSGEHEKTQALEEDVTQGALRIVKDDGTVVECPLRHTDVRAEVAGFIAWVKVTQTFYNPTDDRIEAVYVFPLPHEAAVDEMTMVIGRRKIVGLIKRRAEARQIYEQALAAGQTAALLEQERPNIFTQSVGNIDPGQEVKIEIGYVDVLNYDMGTYEFHFPMVVGPRFMPGAPITNPTPTPPELRGKVSPPVPNTTRVPDASRISPPVLKPGYRNGHDISLSLRLDAGVPIQGLKVANHEVEIVTRGKRRAEVTLSPADSIPNKDFVLRYHVVGKKPEMAVLGHTGDYTDAGRLGRGYFMLMIQPREDERLTKSPPREIVFLLDVSGSMRGQKTEKVKEAMRDMLALCRDIDTMQVITFAGRTHQLFEKPVPVNRPNVEKALNFTANIQGSGGTYMLEGVKRAIDQPIDDKRVRIVIMLSDGFIGNEAEIIEHVGKSCGDQIRFWAIGIGSSPNMFLIDGVARQGGGMGKRLGLNDSAAGLAEEVITRIQRAQLAKIKIDWGNLQVAETYPAKIPELWAGRPVVLFGRYREGGAAEINVRGVVEGEPVSWPLRVTLPEDERNHDVLAKVWARQKIEDLMQQTYYMGSPAVEEEVTAIALDYRLMSQYTSFVAVDESEAKELANQRPARPPRRMLVPVPLPEGSQWEGFFGPLGEEQDEAKELAAEWTVRRGQLSALKRLAVKDRMVNGIGIGGYGAFAPAREMASSGPAPMAMMPMQAGQPALAQSLQQLSGATLSRRSRQATPSSAVGNRFHYAPGLSSGSAPTPRLSAGLALDALGDRADAEGADSFTSADAYTANALADNTEQLVTAAQRHLESGRKRLEKKENDQAWADLTRAYFLATAAANRGNYQAAQMASVALADLQSLHANRVEAWKKTMPSLGTKLDIVLRDVSVDEALEAIAGAGKLTIRLLDGSVQDASDMLAGRDVRVPYLDLRGATVAQALDWTLQPLRLTWQPNADQGDATIVLAGSTRRMPGVSAWVYDVWSIALPSKKELEGLQDRTQVVAKTKELADQFIGTVRKALNAPAAEITWFAPGRLLIIGDQARHGRAADLIAQLSDPDAKPIGSLAALHRQTSQRARDRREAVQEVRELNRLIDTIAVHDQFSWQLFAAALAGDIDDEALTELQIAWRSEQMKKLLEGKGARIALRSAWAITAASDMLPEQIELSRFANQVRRSCRLAAQKAVSALKDASQDGPSILTALYGALVMGDQELNAKVLAALPSNIAPDSPVAALVFAARGLFGEPGGIGSQQRVSLLTTGRIQGEDATVLVAIACRRAGGDTWTTFRAEMRDLLSKQPLPGSVVVLINRLGGHVPQFAKS